MKKLLIILSIVILTGCQAVHTPPVSYHDAMRSNLKESTPTEKAALKIFMVSMAVIVLTSI